MKHNINLVYLTVKLFHFSGGMMDKDKFLERVKEVYTQSEASAINKAVNMSEVALSDCGLGAYYFPHAIAVADLLIDYNLDYETVTVALMHDVVRKTSVTYDQINEMFGKEVGKLLMLFDKISDVEYDRGEEVNNNFDNIRQMFVALAKDIRVILIKICERYHELLTLEHFDSAKQIKIATETKDIFVPLLERLGMGALKSKIEDLCFKYLNPKEYANLSAELEAKFKKRSSIMAQIRNELNGVLTRLKIQGEVTSRFKHLYSIYRKMQKSGMDKIYDILAFRIIVESIKDCYAILGEIHSIYKPVPGRIKDYIASPKPNGYKSLHTTLLTSDNLPFEVQIRTREMHEFCEFGIAAHWKYKEGRNKDDKLEERINWFRKTLENENQIKDSENFVNALKMDLATGEIWVFTPKHKPINLPENATPIDFAYAIHSKIGNLCVGAIVNGKMAPLLTSLSNGDVVEIMTNANSKGPSRDWLNFARSSTARSQIRTFFKKESKESNIKLGKEILELEAKKCGYPLSELLADIDSSELVKRFNILSFDDLYASVGYGGLTAKQVLGKPVAERKNKEKLARKIEEVQNKQAIIKDDANAVIVDGISGLAVRFGQCCKPIAGDEIVAFSSSRGITIHRATCPNIKQINSDRKRDVRWLNDSGLFVRAITVIVGNNSTALNKITTMLSNIKVNIVAINSKIISPLESEIKIVIQVENREREKDVLNKLAQIQDVKVIG